MKRKIVTTTDGSHSIYLEEMDEHYHSKHGAIEESEHIFIKHGLVKKAESASAINIFEVGLGTGLNFLTTYKALLNLNVKVAYHAIEAFPVGQEELDVLNFHDLLGIDKKVAALLHQSPDLKTVEVNAKLRFRKYYSDLTAFDFEQLPPLDVVYFDSFAPEKQPEMWTEDVFSKIFAAMNAEGILVTYCVKGEIRRRLQKVGFTIEKLKGPEGGKREMCRAWKR